MKRQMTPRYLGNKQMKNMKQLMFLVKISDHKAKDIYPGVSNQKRVRIRAEELFGEGQANKAIQKQAAFQH
eukprot:5723097-Heterocapsa_arctica.AAC.1